jgi:uridine kinase
MASHGSNHRAMGCASVPEWPLTGWRRTLGQVGDGRGVTVRRDVVRRLADRIESIACSHPARVAIDGPDAAGKTTLADEVAAVLADRGRKVIRASIDGFHRPRAERYRQGPDSPVGYYEDSFDYEQLRRALLDPLGPEGDCVCRTGVFDYRMDRANPAPALSVAPDSILVFDGVFLLRPELADAWDFRVFVTADFDEILRRVCVRDVTLFGSVEVVEQRYRTRYIPGQQRYFEAARPTEVADVVVSNDDPDRPVLHE